MKAVTTLLWYEARRNAWVIYGASAGLVAFTLVLLLLPNAVSGLDLLGVPEPGEEPAPGNRSRFSISKQEQANGAVTSSRRFEWSFGFGADEGQQGDEVAVPATPEDPAPEATDPARSPSLVKIPDELQVAFRPRQAATLMGAMLLAAATLLALFVAHVREADAGEMTLHYQSPVAPEAQLAIRLAFLAGLASLVFAGAVAIHALVQTSQSLSPGFPIAEGLGSIARVDWTNVVLASVTTQILPTAAFILLFVQVQNAFDLFGGARLAGFVLAIAGFLLALVSYEVFVSLAVEGGPALSIIDVEGQPRLSAAIIDFDLTRFRYEVPLPFIAAGLLAAFAMWFVAARIFREVEWS